MRIEEFIGEEWVNITSFIHPTMHNMGDGTEWQINLSLYTDTDKTRIVGSRDIGAIAGNGIVLRKDHPDYIFRLIKTVLGDAPTYLVSESAFIIMAKKREAQLKN